MEIKKAFVPLVEYLEQNQEKTVREVMPDVMKYAHSKKRKKMYTENGRTFLHCWVHDCWHDLAEVEFNKDPKTSSGYCGSCREGAAEYARLLSAIKKDEDRARREAEEEFMSDKLSKQAYKERLGSIGRITLERKEKARRGLK